MQTTRPPQLVGPQTDGQLVPRRRSPKCNAAGAETTEAALLTRALTCDFAPSCVEMKTPAAAHVAGATTRPVGTCTVAATPLATSHLAAAVVNRLIAVASPGFRSAHTRVQLANGTTHLAIRPSRRKPLSVNMTGLLRRRFVAIGHKHVH